MNEGDMDARFAKTRYRVAQHWRFRHDVPEASDVLVILAVEEHPDRGIICNVGYECQPAFRTGPCSFTSGGESWVTQDALDRSVIEQAAEKGPLPSSYGTTGEFR